MVPNCTRITPRVVGMHRFNPNEPNAFVHKLGIGILWDTPQRQYSNIWKLGYKKQWQHRENDCLRSAIYYGYLHYMCGGPLGYISSVP